MKLCRKPTDGGATLKGHMTPLSSRNRSPQNSQQTPHQPGRLAPATYRRARPHRVQEGLESRRHDSHALRFANDFENLGGGYVIIGQDCNEDGQPIFPRLACGTTSWTRFSGELLATCNLIQPPYFPILSIEKVKGKNLLVLWAPGGQNRPYKAPKEVTAKHRVFHYYIRRYSSTVEARDATSGNCSALRPRSPSTTGSARRPAWRTSAFR